MSDVSVVGLGSMGSALARGLIGAGHDVTVRNRTSARANVLVAVGAVAAPSAALAVAASPVTMVCVDDCTVTCEILGSDDVGRSPAGRVLV